MTDQVNHPDHYGGEDNPFEVIKVLRAWDLELAKGFVWGNVIKYIARAERKGNLADYKKADWYAAELVSIEEELAKRPKPPATIPVIIPGPGNYKLVIDWDKRTHKLVVDYSSVVPRVGSDGGSGGDYKISGGLSSVTTVHRCTNLAGCHGGYHALRCPLSKDYYNG